MRNRSIALHGLKGLCLGFFLCLSSEAFAGSFFWPRLDQITSGQYQNSQGVRAYTLFKPSKPNSGSGLLVVLHGCFMTGLQMMEGTALNALAEAKSVYVLYPEQTYQENPWKCWNWFLPENQQRKTGELSILAEMTGAIVRQFKINSKRVFVAGLSAGGAMASNLLGCYRDVFAGGVFHSGLEFAAAQTESDAHEVTKTGPGRDLDVGVSEALKCDSKSSRLQKFLVFHGDADSFVNSINGRRTFEFLSRMNERLHEVFGGNSKDFKIEESLLEPQDPLMHEAQVTTQFFKERVLGRNFMVKGMGHGWSGGLVVSPYMEPRGIPASRILFEELF